MSFATGQYPARVKTGDFDGDGIHDIAVVNFNSSFLSILRNTSVPGSVQLQAKIDLPTPGAPRNIAIGDLNNDGKPDLVAGIDGTKFTIFQNGSSGMGNINFTRQDISWLSAPVAVGIDDLDGDGRLDLIVSGAAIGNEVSVYQNNGSGNNFSFKNPVVFSTSNNVNLLSTADLNNTGKRKLFVAAQARWPFTKTVFISLSSLHFHQQRRRLML